MKIDHFGILAPFYERFIAPRVPKKLLELLNLPETGIILDAGGGTGRIAQFLTGKTDQVFVVDQSHKMLREARKKDNLLPVCSLTEDFPFSENTIDRIIMVDALHHVINQRVTTQELWRILKPGGRLIIEEPDIHSFGVKLVALAEKIALMHSHFLSSSQIVGLFRSQVAQLLVIKEDSTVWVIVDKEQKE